MSEAKKKLFGLFRSRTPSEKASTQVLLLPLRSHPFLTIIRRRTSESERKIKNDPVAGANALPQRYALIGRITPSNILKSNPGNRRKDIVQRAPALRPQPRCHGLQQAFREMGTSRRVRRWS